MSDNQESGGYYTGDIHNQFVEEHHDPKSKSVIWRTFWILLFITLFEVGIAFSAISKQVLMVVFIALTIVKAYFIVAFFMHLKHEKQTFSATIILPFLLIVYLIVMCITEGNYIHIWGVK